MPRLGIIMLVIGLLPISGCESLNLRPASNIDIAELEQRADKAYQNADWPNAEQAYRDLTELEPEAAEPWYRLGNIYVHLNQPDKAFTAYGEVLSRQPEHVRAWHNLGILQLRQATRSFLHLEQITSPDDPLNQRARGIVNSVSNLLEQELNTSREPGTADSEAEHAINSTDQNRLENGSRMAR